MLTLSRAGSPITCLLEQRAQAGVRQPVERLTRSLRRTVASFPLTLVALLGTPFTGSAQQPPPGLVEVRDGGNRHGFWFGRGRPFYLNPVVDLVGHRYDGRAGGSYRERLVNFGLGFVAQGAS